MRLLVLLVFCLHHCKVLQAESDKSTGEPVSHQDLCDSKLLSEVKEVRNTLREQQTLMANLINQQSQLGNTCGPESLYALAELKSTVENQRVQLEALQKQLADKPNVAFSATLLGHGGETIGGLKTEMVLIFKKIFVNIGNAYNVLNGRFTAPVKGVYYFGFSAFANGQHGMGVHLRKNGEQVVATYDYNNNHKDVNGANRAILQLEVGDQVYIGLWSGLHIFDSYNSVSTFSGFLIFPI